MATGAYFGSAVNNLGASMTWRLAKALVKLREQVNQMAPKRSKTADGSIGDEAHASRSSDHNPWVDGGVVTAIDITHDPQGGFDSYKFAEDLRKNQDDRIKYVISNGRIFSSQVDPWVWRPYNGSNKHDHHVHISVSSMKLHYDDETEWTLGEKAFPRPNLKRPSEPAKVVVLSKGARGKEVEELQKLLGLVEVDAVFGPKTEEAVRAYQKTKGLYADGVVGAYTWEQLRKGK